MPLNVWLSIASLSFYFLSYAMPMLVWLSIAFILYLNNLFYSNIMHVFKLCYRLLSVIPIFFLCLFSLNMLYYIQEKDIYGMPLLVWLFYSLYFMFNSLLLFEFHACFQVMLQAFICYSYILLVLILFKYVLFYLGKRYLYHA